MTEITEDGEHGSVPHEQDNTHERRHFHRIPKEATLEITKLEYPLNQSPAHKSALRDITPDGIRCVVPIAYPVGTLINMRIALKGWQLHRQGVRSIIDAEAARAPLTAIGEVMWCKSLANNDHEIGVHLINIYRDDYTALISYLNNLVTHSIGDVGAPPPPLKLREA